jgi:hypothetical protein
MIPRPFIVAPDRAAAAVKRGEQAVITAVGADNLVLPVGYADGNNIVEYILQPGPGSFQFLDIMRKGKAEQDEEDKGRDTDVQFVGRRVQQEDIQEGTLAGEKEIVIRDAVSDPEQDPEEKKEQDYFPFADVHAIMDPQIPR